MNNQLTCGIKRDRSYLLWTFLIPFALMLLIYALDRVFPFGDRSVLVLDLNGQYVGFFEALRDAVYGDASLLYSFARSLGGEMMGIYAYYLASPLSYIVALFPEGYMTEALLLMFLIKAGLCGLTFGIYLHKKAYSSRLETLLFSTLYALCSFAIVMQHNTMWIDNIILLPLVTLGVESVIKYRRYRLFVFSLSLALLSNFYIGFMTCIYVLLYFFYYFYAFSEGEQNNPLGEQQHYLRALLRMALYSLLSVAIAAIILLTVAYSLSFGKTTFTDPNYLPYLQFDPIRFFSKLLPGVYDTVEPSGLPFVYCGTLTLLLVPLYFANRRFSRRERICSGILLAVFYLSMSINSLDMLWHGGQAPNWLNYRYSFMLCFILLLLASRAFARLADYKNKTILSVTVILLALVAVAASMNDAFFTTTHAVLAASLLLIFTALLIYMKKQSGRLRQYLAVLLLSVALVEAFYNGTAQIAALHKDVGSTDRQEYLDYHASVGSLVDAVKEQDDEFYRMEVIGHRVTNDVMELGYRGLTSSTSTLNAKTLDFLHRMGLLATSHWSEYYGTTLALDSLLGLRYIMMSNSTSLHSAYEAFLANDENTVYRNPHALPIAFASSGQIKEDDQTALSSPLIRQNEIIRAVLGTRVPDCYIPLPCDFTSENVLTEAIEWNGKEYHAIYTNAYIENEQAFKNGEIDEEELYSSNSLLAFQITVPQDGPLYFYIETDLPSKLDLYLQDTYYGVIYEDGNDFVKGLGYFEAGDVVTVTLRMAECYSFYFPTDAVAFFLEDTDATIDNLTAIGQNGITLDRYREDYFHGSITTTKERPTVQTTIPYDAGWQITVDGKRVTPYATLDALLAFDTEPGTHTVEMVYRPTCYVLGSAISLLGVLLLAALITVEELWRRGRLCPQEGSRLYRLLDVFFYQGKIGAEPNFLSDEEMQKAEDARHPQAEEAAGLTGEDPCAGEQNSEENENG